MPRLFRAAAVVLVAVLATVGLLFAASPASAAERGAGFGAWAPLSAYGWHGSMLVNGVHTYCIRPGAPVPTGTTTDNGIRGDAAGLSPEQLTQINFLVSAYGQTDDPVRAASVAWAVKAIANWDQTLHGFGYDGDSLAGAVDRVFRRLAPEHNAEVQRLAVAYYDEAKRMTAGAVSPIGSLVFTADAADHRSGTVRVEATAGAATGSLTLVNAAFADTGAATRHDALVGVEYAIATTPPAEGRPYSVSGGGRFSAGFAPAVRYFTTAGGQDTAGPAGVAEFDVAGADAAPRVPPFAPRISTQVESAYVADAPFVDSVEFALDGEWPRGEDGAYLPVAATALVYRTETAPTLSPEPPADAEPVGELTLETDPELGPTAPYVVVSSWSIMEAGFYTAVWEIRADAQSEDVSQHLGADFAWREEFGEPSQVAVSPDVSTRAQPVAEIGGTMSDTVVVGGAIASVGLDIVAAVYRAVDGVAPAESCVPESLVWESEPLHVDGPGEYVFTASEVPGAGTYYWQERAIDERGTDVHRGICGIENETTRVAEPSPTPEPPVAALAATGAEALPVRPLLVGAGILTLGVALIAGARRRREAAGRGV